MAQFIISGLSIYQSNALANYVKQNEDDFVDALNEVFEKFGAKVIEAEYHTQTKFFKESNEVNICLGIKN